MQLPNREALDKDVAEALAHLSEKQRKEAKQLMGNPPDIRKIPAHKWLEWQEETEAEIAILLLLMFHESARYHAPDADDEQITILAERWALPVASELTVSVMQTTHDTLVNRVSQWEEEARAAQERGESYEVSTAEIDEALDQVYGETRTERLGSDIVTMGQSAGGESIVAEIAGLSDLDTWKNNPHRSSTGVCRRCAALHQQPRTVWHPLYPNGPPAHPNCVCEIVYANLEAIPHESN